MTSLGSSSDPADRALAAGLEALRRAALVSAWLDCPPPFDRPPLDLEMAIGEAAAGLLAKRVHPARVTRALGRRWPLYRRACSAIVRAVLARAREEARRAA